MRINKFIASCGVASRRKAEELIAYLKEEQPVQGEIVSIEKKKEKKNIYMLAFQLIWVGSSLEKRK